MQYIPTISCFYTSVIHENGFFVYNCPFPMKGTCTEATLSSIRTLPGIGRPLIH